MRLAILFFCLECGLNIHIVASKTCLYLSLGASPIHAGVSAQQLWCSCR